MNVKEEMPQTLRLIFHTSQSIELNSRPGVTRPVPPAPMLGSALEQQPLAPGKEGGQRSQIFPSPSCVNQGNPGRWGQGCDPSLTSEPEPK